MYRWTIRSVIFSAACTAAGFGSSLFSGSATTDANSAASGESATEFNGWLSFDPSR